MALENTPAFPAYPHGMNVAEIGKDSFFESSLHFKTEWFVFRGGAGAGLVLTYAAQTIMGNGGAAAVLLLSTFPAWPTIQVLRLKYRL